MYAPAVNSIATVTSGSVTSAPSPDIFINPDATVYAYYPAIADEIVNPDRTSTKDITVDLSNDLSATEQIDYLWATPTDVCRTNCTNVSLTFNHALAKVVFKVTLKESYVGDKTLTQIKLSTVSSTYKFKCGNGTMSIADGSITLPTEDDELTCSGTKTLSGTASDVIALVASTLLAENTSATSEITLSMTIGNVTYSTSLPVNTVAEWAGGNYYIYDISVGSKSISISEVSVSGWIGGAETDITVD